MAQQKESYAEGARRKPIEGRDELLGLGIYKADDS
jgi:hypothetical protein